MNNDSKLIVSDCPLQAGFPLPLTSRLPPAPYKQLGLPLRLTSRFPPAPYKQASPCPLQAGFPLPLTSRLPPAPYKQVSPCPLQAGFPLTDNDSNHLFSVSGYEASPLPIYCLVIQFQIPTPSTSPNRHKEEYCAYIHKVWFQGQTDSLSVLFLPLFCHRRQLSLFPSDSPPQRGNLGRLGRLQ